MIINPITLTLPKHVVDELMNAGIQRLQRLTPGSKGEKSTADPKVVKIIEDAFVAHRFGKRPTPTETHLATVAAERIAALATGRPCDQCSR